MARAVAFVAALAGAMACSSAPEPHATKLRPSGTSRVASAPSASSKARGLGRLEVARLPAPARLVALGDLHGDLAATRHALRLAGAIDGDDHWAGGALVVVQTGDEIDRGDDDRAVVDLFERLAREAKAAGGAVLALSGNHEVMNVSLDFRYVTPRAFDAFVGVAPIDVSDPRLGRLPEVARPRAAAFLPGGPYARKLAGRPLVAVVGDSVFVHGGLEPKHLRYGVDRLNREMAAWMRGETPSAPAIALSEDAPTWLRRYSAAPDAGDCDLLGETLAALDAKRMVVGHTVQRGGISAACGERVWRIDVGLASFYGGKPEVLAIEGENVSVLRE